HGINAAAHKLAIWVGVIFGVLGCLLTGLIYGLFPDWGFFRQRWLALKWLILLVAVTSGTFFLGEWEKAMLALSEEYGLAALRRADFTAIRSRHLWGTMLQLSMLFFVLFLSVFKPWRKKDGQGR
ncbi:MAG: hypothetical protein LBD82_00635, partial [Deltaproteobacteria bacterium]|nr:hypothetical protein [Deltaproteobacteria bacterium]